ncbi:MAG: META domain-containing protein [Chthoniobacterales bacterium]|nr:META domain-containing protein [Chthoniobacterales bacterium]
MKTTLAILLAVAFHAASAMGNDPKTLALSSWTVTELGGTALDTDKPPTLEFDAEGQIAGDSSCNRYGGPCLVEGNTISVSRLRLTRRMCDEETMARERKFMTLLQAAQTWEITDTGTLVLHGSEGDIMATRQAAEGAQETD